MISPEAVIYARSLWEVVGLVAIVTTLLGTWFAWHRTQHRADVEDEIKDRKLSEEAASKRIRFIEFRGTFLIWFGLALVLLALVGLSL